MIWIALAAATSQLSAPPAQSYTADTRTLFRANDYPAAALARGEQGTVFTRLYVDPTGRVEGCEIEQSSGSKDLDFTTCEVLRRRAKFRPITGPGDAPLYLVIRTPPITWSIGGPSSTVPAPGPDVELDLNQAPPGVSLPIDVSVNYIVKADGKVTSCKPSRELAAGAAALVPLACDPSHLPPSPILRNVAGNLVDALYSATLRFTLAR